MTISPAIIFNKIKNVTIGFSQRLIFVAMLLLILAGVGVSVATAIVIVEPTDEISDTFFGQDETTNFIESFYSTGVNIQTISFVGVYWPTGNMAAAKTVTGLGSRPANTPAQEKRELTFNIPYATSTIPPGATYEYEIRDTTGAVYYRGSFTRPGTPTGSSGGPQPPVSTASSSDGVSVTSSLSSDGQTVTFTVTGTPASGADVDFDLDYFSTANATFSGTIESVGVRSAGATSSQTFSYTIKSPYSQTTLIDAQGFLVDSGTISYDLFNHQTGYVYVSGMFGSNPALAMSSETTPTDTTNPVTVTPKDSGSAPKVIASSAPDLSGGLVPCDGRSGVNACGWGKLVELIDKFMTWLLWMTVPISAIMFAYAGFLFLSKGASEEARSKAKGIFINVFIGLLFIMGAFLIIKTILNALGVGGAYSSFL